MTESMQKTIDETTRRREKQIQYNIEHNITPTTIIKSIEQIMGQTSVLDIKGTTDSPYAIDDRLITIAAEDQVEYKTIPQMEKAISQNKDDDGKSRKGYGFYGSRKIER